MVSGNISCVLTACEADFEEHLLNEHDIDKNKNIYRWVNIAKKPVLDEDNEIQIGGNVMKCLWPVPAVKTPRQLWTKILSPVC